MSSRNEEFLAQLELVAAFVHEKEREATTHGSFLGALIAIIASNQTSEIDWQTKN